MPNLPTWMIERVVPACDLSKSVDDAFRVDVERVLDLTRVISGVTKLVEINVKNVAFRFCRAMTVPGQRAILTILKPDFRGRDASYLAPHRVAGGSCPPPAPTERGVRISRTTLFGSWFTAFTAICSSFVSMVG
jgi:hypothetical protein